IANVVSLDPSLSARVLRLSGSAYFGLFAPVESIFQAVSVIGTSKLHSLVFAGSAISALSNLKIPLDNIDTFWQHSVRTALAAGSLAARGKARDRDRIFLAAMMHDIGQLVMYHQLPEISSLVLDAVSQNANREGVERELMGFTHAEVGAEL